MAKYSASINFHKKWTWENGNSPHIDMNGRPRFKHGDTLTLCVDGRPGPHRIRFAPSPFIRTPFAAPFDVLDLHFEAEAELRLVKLQPESLEPENWQFTIFSGSDKQGIDPELQVGSGGHLGDPG